MKIRNGFVSNSSSSSFIALVPKTEWAALMNTKDPMEQAIIESMATPVIFCDIECMEYSVMTGNHDTIQYLEWDDVKERAQEIAKEKNVVLSEDDLDNIKETAYNLEFEYDLDKLGDRIYIFKQSF